jgi:penicillin-binding protein 1A
VVQRLRQLAAGTTLRGWLVRAGIAFGAFVVVAFVGLLVAYNAVSLPDEPDRAQTSVVLDSDGEVLSELYAEENRVDVPLDEVAPVLREAVIAAEDRSFYRHSGLDPVGIGRALWNDIRGGALQGGSTITQQLVKNAYLSPDRTLRRKVNEALLTVKLEREASKDEIFERYLNTVYFGRGAYGIEAAAQIYFGVSAAELQLPQAALLAGLIRAPETADPDRDPEAAQQRRDLVLQAMVATGDIEQAEADATSRQPVDALGRLDPEDLLAGSHAYFVAHVSRLAVGEVGEQQVFGGGLRIHTTLDSRMQDAAERAVGEVLNQHDDPDAALVSVDDSGAVRAMIGGRDFRESKVNLALGTAGGGLGRQPGSTFKPFVLAAAIEEGLPVAERYPAPAEITLPAEPEPWTVANYGNRDLGELDLLAATAQSSNTVYAQLVMRVGPEKVVELANRVGITSEMPAVPALALGVGDVSPIDMADAYLTFATRGERVTPHFITRITTADGDELYSAEPERERVMEEDHADLMNHALQGVITSGTGRSASIPTEAAGKTGTTQDNADAWFVGYTPRLSTAVWMGYKESTERKMDSVRGRSVTGGSFPAEIWQRFMAEATAGADHGAFHDPPRDLLVPPTSAPPPPTEPPPPEPEDLVRHEDDEPEETTTTTESTTTTTTTTSTTTSTTTTTAPPPDDGGGDGGGGDGGGGDGPGGGAGRGSAEPSGGGGGVGG